MLCILYSVPRNQHYGMYSSQLCHGLLELEPDWFQDRLPLHHGHAYDCRMFIRYFHLEPNIVKNTNKDLKRWINIHPTDSHQIFEPHSQQLSRPHLSTHCTEPQPWEDLLILDVFSVPLQQSRAFLCKEQILYSYITTKLNDSIGQHFWKKLDQ